VKCRLLTGRTHQIRVHMAEAGHPLIGDPLYGRNRGKPRRRLAPPARSAVEGFARQALHAATLGFRHPLIGEDIRLESPLPEDMRALIAALSDPP
jgi:23S rRNA pseudouridine1911/1915/1917 synthase